jgi:hypothetical protein
MTTTTTQEDAVPDPTTAPPQRKPFAQFLQEARKGGLHTELSDELAELVHSCTETGKKGKLSLTVTVIPSKDMDGTVAIVDDVKVTAPKPDARPSLFWADDSGNLSRTNPAQAELPLTAVRGGRADDGDDDSRASRAGTGAS